MEILLLRLVLGVATLYGAAVGYMSIRETALVYPGMGRAFRMVPGREVGFPWDTMRVTAADSVPVLLLETRVDTASQRPWIFYLHGNLGLLGARGNVARYQLFREAGFNVLAVEYRGFGASASAGKPSEDGIYADAAAGWNYLTRTRGISKDRVVIYGLSLGGGPATWIAQRDTAAVLVTEGTSTALPDVGAGRYPWLPVRLIMRNRYPNLDRAPNIAMPWIIFHGRNDVHVPIAHGERLAAAAKAATFVALQADHDGGVIEDRRTALPVLADLARRIANPAADRDVP